MYKPAKMDVFMWMLMKEAKRNSLFDLLVNVEISEEEYIEIEKYFETLNIQL